MSEQCTVDDLRVSGVLLPLHISMLVFVLYCRLVLFVVLVLGIRLSYHFCCCHSTNMQYM